MRVGRRGAAAATTMGCGASQPVDIPGAAEQSPADVSAASSAPAARAAVSSVATTAAAVEVVSSASLPLLPAALPAPLAVPAGRAPWTDTEFPPDALSLFGAEPRHRDSTAAEQANELDAEHTRWRDFVWRRASDIMAGNGNDRFSLFEGIGPEDILQGVLGDCYFLGALACLALHPERIRRLFVTKAITSSGRYELQLYKGGQPIHIVVDDFFPCTGVSGGFSFARCNGSELWVQLLEKAWAKLHGCYQNIESGNVGQALQDLTGAPQKSIPLGGATGAGFVEVGSSSLDLEGIWAELSASCDAGYSVAASVPAAVDGTDKLQASVGLITEHVYSVLRVMTLPPSCGSERLVQLRNPWGKGEWSGAWSDSSMLWTDEARAVAQLVQANDGIFWVCLADFCTYFESFSVIAYHDDWHHTQCVFQASRGEATGLPQHQPDECWLQLSVPEPLAGAVLTLHQPDNRLFTHAEDTYGGMALEVLQLSSDGRGATSADMVLISQPVKGARELSIALAGGAGVVGGGVVGSGVSTTHGDDSILAVGKYLVIARLNSLAALAARMAVSSDSSRGTATTSASDLLLSSCVSLYSNAGGATLSRFEASALPLLRRQRLAALLVATRRLGSVQPSPAPEYSKTSSVRHWQHQGGLAMLYENFSSNLTVTELTDFIGCQNCHLSTGAALPLSASGTLDDVSALEEVDDNAATMGTLASSAPKLKVIVEPGHARLVLLEITELGSKWACAKEVKFSVERNVDYTSPTALAELQAEVRAHGETHVYEFSDQIKWTQLQFESGQCFLFENRSIDWLVQESLVFELENMVVVGRPKGTTQVEISLGPGVTEFVVVRMSEAGVGFSLGMERSFSAKQIITPN